MLLFRAAFGFSKAAAAVERGAARQVHAEELLDRGKEPFGWYSMGQAFPGRRPCRSGESAYVFATFSILHIEIG